MCICKMRNMDNRRTTSGIKAMNYSIWKSQIFETGEKKSHETWEDLWDALFIWWSSFRFPDNCSLIFTLLVPSIILSELNSVIRFVLDLYNKSFFYRLIVTKNKTHLNENCFFDKTFRCRLNTDSNLECRSLLHNQLVGMSYVL